MTTPVHRRSACVGSLLALVAVLTCSHPMTAAAQEPAKVTVDLGTADGPPGRTLSIPINVGLPEGAKASELEITIKFDKGLLAFTRAELAPQGKADRVDLTTSVADDPDNKTGSILTVKAVGAAPIGSGAIADLSFRINPKAKPPTGSTGHKAAKFTAVLKKHATVKLADGTAATAEGRDGGIDITEGVAIFGCFFYMH